MGEEKLLYCYNKGCGVKFDPDDNKNDSCLYHPGAPYFHDAYKIWSCCNQKSTDFSTWLSLKGCTRGQHSNQKTVVETKPEKSETKIKSQTPEEIIVWNGLNKPADRHSSLEIMRRIKFEVTDGALNAIEKFKSEVKEEAESVVHVGVSCKNPGCEKIYEGEKSKNEKCIYHSGVAVFHEGMKYWSCCEKKTSDFSIFLEQKGCTEGKHCWTKAERVDKIREDWFSGGGFIHLNVYCKGAIPESCKVESNGLILQIQVVHGFGAKETQLNYELFGRINVDASKVIIGERKLELILKQEDIARRMKNQLNSIGLFHSVEAIYTGGAIQWSLDGRTLFSACGNYIKASNLNDGKLSYKIGSEEESLRISTFLLNENCSSVVVAYTNGLLRNYRLPSLESGSEVVNPEIIRQWKSTNAGPILVMKFSRGDILLATGSADFVVKVWNLEERSCIGSLKNTSAVSAIEFLDKSRVVVGCTDGSSSLFCLENPKKLIFRWTNHTSQIVSIIIERLPEVVFVSRDQTLSIVNVDSYEKIKVLPLFEPVEASVLASGSLFTVGEEGVLKCWNLENAKLLRSANIYGSRINSIIYNQVCKKFLLATSDFNVFWVDEETFKIERQFAGFNDEIFDICFFGPKLEYLIAATNSSELRFYDTNTWSCHLITGHTDSVLSLSTASWDPMLFASSSKDNTFIIWNVDFNDDEEMKVEKAALATGHTNNVTCVRFSNSSKHRFIVSVSNDTTIKLWPLKNLREKTESLKLQSSATLVAHAKDITCLDISLNDRLCVTGSMDKTAKLWHIETDKMHFTIGGMLNGHRRGVWDARFSPSTQAVVTCSGDCMIRVFSLPSRDCIATLAGHPSAVLNGVIVNSGKQIISADSGGLLKIWDIAANECITTVEAHDEKIWALQIANDESRLATAGSDGRIRIWEDISEKKREEEERSRAEKAHNEQILTNLMQQNHYAEALSFSLTLARPYSCLKIVQAMMELESDELHNAVQKLREEELVVLLNFASQWNTNSRTADVAQLVLYCVLHSFPPEALLKMPNFASVIEAYIPYTIRHFDRLTRARQNAAFLNYTLAQMSLSNL